MKIIELDPNFINNDHINLDLDEEGTAIHAVHSIEDVIFNNPDTDILWWIGCPHETTEFPSTQGILVPGKSEIKEFNKVCTNIMAFRTVKGKGRLFLVLQRN